MAYLDLEQWGLREWLDPREAMCASIDSQKKLLAGLIATRLQVQREWLTGDRPKRREMERFLDDLNKTGIMITALLKAEGVS